MFLPLIKTKQKNEESNFWPLFGKEKWKNAIQQSLVNHGKSLIQQQTGYQPGDRL